MSLDVSLIQNVNCLCPHCVSKHERFEVFSANITHNLGRMAAAVSPYFYQALWRPEELFEDPRASDIAPIIRKGLDSLISEPARFQAYDSPNGWGTYGDFVPWVKRYLAACEDHPDAIVSVSR